MKATKKNKQTLLDNTHKSHLPQVVRSIYHEENLSKDSRHPKDHVGHFMQRETVIIPSFWAVEDVLRLLSQNDNLPDISHGFFVVDSFLHPIGYVTLHKLLKANPISSISDIMKPSTESIPIDMHQGKLAKLFRKDKCVSVPVTDLSGRIMGIVTLDSVVSIIHKEATEDVLKIAGVIPSKHEESVFITAFTRFKWLLITLFSALIASWIIYLFEKTINQIAAVAVLMPIIAAMGGNAGIQVVTTTVRALALGEFKTNQIGEIAWKELKIATINGLIFAGLLIPISYFWFENYPLGLVLGSALIFNILWAGMAGTLIPVVLDKLGLDPATGAGPLISITTDVLGFASFLGFAAMFLL